MANQRTQLEIALRYDVYFIKRLYSSETSLSLFIPRLHYYQIDIVILLCHSDMLFDIDISSERRLSYHILTLSYRNKILKVYKYLNLKK